MRYCILKVLLDLLKRYFLGLVLWIKFNQGQFFLEILLAHLILGLQIHSEPTFRTNLSSLLVFLIRCWGQIFHTTWLYFIGNLRHVNIIMDFGKISFKAQKNSYLHKEASKFIVQAHSTSSHFLVYDPSSWVLLGEFWELWFGGPRSMFSKALVVQSW